jgi:hypothetical protein
MNCVSLVGTVHEEMGRANASELHVILERLRPEVIFLEVPPAAMDDFYESGIRTNLESIAVRQYQETHQVELIPVDLPTPEREFFENLEALHIRVRESSSLFRQLMNQDNADVRAHGFSYLNSDHCSKLWSDVYEEMLRTISGLGDSRLIEIYESWKKVLDLREIEMIRNIQNYCGKNSFDRGVLLAGAAHRQPIMEKSREQTQEDATGIQWDFSGLLS